ncbi:MBL fold metallo-hydrolase [uncultured Roseobacter sp.]|uniref:MBL fold metallo-hydrolase n=1 Tax=uncultured Roseobacter sp. TaxID=114847 RepID=UPI0026313F6B|nr:MBL fold metallo-hydrolase [uncultured Roseobacter sp.]
MKDHPGDGIRTPWEEPPKEGEAIEVAPGVLWMRLPLPMKLDHVNVYALDDGDGWTVVDTGMASKRGKAIWRALLEGPLAGRALRRVVVTHHHPDHIGMAGWLMAETGAELVMTRTAWLMARMLTLDEQALPPAETLTFYRRAGMATDIYDARATERPFNFADVVSPLPLGYTRIQQDDRIEMGGRSWDVHIGNGHAPEHATFWSRDDASVLAGDQILSSISPNIGVYPTEPMADPIADWLEACERLAELARPDHLVLGGHKLPFTGLPLRMQQLIGNHHGALARLLEYLETPKAAGECFAPLFKRSIGAGEYGLALVEAVAHLSHLHQTGLATRSLRDDDAWVYQRKD